MTELAYSGVGYNPHYGTPKNICSMRLTTFLVDRRLGAELLLGVILCLLPLEVIQAVRSGAGGPERCGGI